MTLVARLATDDHVLFDVTQVVVDTIEGELLLELLMTTEASLVLLQEVSVLPSVWRRLSFVGAACT